MVGAMSSQPNLFAASPASYVPPASPVVMVTGHREVRHPQLVLSRCEQVLSKLGASLAVSGGAEGADSVFADAALRTHTPLHLMLPNRWYRSYYPRSVSDQVVSRASKVSFVVDRPDVPDWRQRWSSQRWWLDNFARNRAMLEAADVWCVISAHRPAELLAMDKGGTAACVKEAARLSPDGFFLWIPDDPELSLRWTAIAGT